MVGAAIIVVVVPVFCTDVSVVWLSAGAAEPVFCMVVVVLVSVWLLAVISVVIVALTSVMLLFCASVSPIDTISPTATTNDTQPSQSVSREICVAHDVNGKTQSLK